MHFVPINFSDPGFNPEYTADYQLIIVLDSEKFSYAVRHSITNRLVRISTGNLLDDLFDPHYRAGVFASNYQKIIIAAETNSFCLIPDAVFTHKNLLDFAAFLLVKEADLILTDQVSNGENTVIFTFPETLIQKVEKQFPSAKIRFAPKSWIKTVFDVRLPGQNLYLFLEENSVQIMFPTQENIRFYNRFDCTTADEVVYFTALVSDQLKLKPEETNLILCGRIEVGSEPMLLLQGFFKDVTLFSTLGFAQNDVLQQHQIVQFLGLN